MFWIVIVFIAVAAVFLTRGRSNGGVEVTAVVVLTVGQPAAVDFEPQNTDNNTLMRLALTYGSKLRWLLLNEPAEIQDIFRELTAEATSFIHGSEASLISQMPTAALIAADVGAPPAAPSREQFRIRYRRTDRAGAPGSSYVINDLPNPGLAVNLAWHFIVLLDAVHARLTPEARRRFADMLLVWWPSVFNDWEWDTSLKSLTGLFAAADAAWSAIAATGTAAGKVNRPGFVGDSVS